MAKENQTYGQQFMAATLRLVGRMERHGLIVDFLMHTILSNFYKGADIPHSVWQDVGSYDDVMDTLEKIGIFNRGVTDLPERVISSLGDAFRKRPEDEIRTFAQFIHEFLPMYESHRASLPNAARFVVDQTLDNMFFVARQLELGEKPLYGKVTEQELETLSRNYDRFTNMIDTWRAQKPLAFKADTVWELEKLMVLYAQGGDMHRFLRYKSLYSGKIGSLPRFKSIEKLNLALEDVRRIENFSRPDFDPITWKEGEGDYVDTHQFMLAMAHFAALNAGKIPQELHEALNETILMMQEQANIVTLDRAYFNLSSQYRRFLVPYHEGLDWRWFKNKEKIRTVEIPQLSVDKYVEEFRSEIATERARILETRDLKGKGKKLITLEAKLQRFEEIISTLPEELEFIVVPYTKRPREETNNLRTHFDQQSRSSFIRKVALLHPVELYNKGMTLGQIFAMVADGQLPSNGCSPAKRMTVEHINDLGGGGHNIHDHMCLMPFDMNQLKDRLQNTQTEDMNEGETRLIVSCAPKKQAGRRFLVQEKSAYPVIVGRAEQGYREQDFSQFASFGFF